MSETKEVEQVTEAKVVEKVSPAVREFAKMATVIPAQDPDEAVESILAQILGSENLDDLDAPWNTTKVEELTGHPLVVHSLKRMTSDFTDGLGVYLVVQAAVKNTGEEVTFTTGSVSIVAQLVKAYVSGWMPLECKLVRAERPTADGYYPQHLELLR